MRVRGPHPSPRPEQDADLASHPVAPPTTFVGRTQDLEAIEGLYRAGARLVTVVGPAGIGKTRLALRYLEERDDGHEVLACDLGASRSLSDIHAALAWCLGTPLGSETGHSQDANRLLDALRERGRMLLLLDNFEHLADHAPETVGAWIGGAEGLRVLVTSRELLRIAGEQAYEVEPLPLPAADTNPAEVRTADSVVLFVDRARAIHPRYALTDATAPLVTRIVRRLEGIPLAIECAAAQVGHLGELRLIDSLEERLVELKSGRRGQAGRHATLRAAIDWSWNLLSEPERSALAQISVFRGGFELDAAEAVIDLSSLQGALPVVEVLGSLRQKSLLRTESVPEIPGSIRYELLESVREYASEHLSERASVEERHADHYLHIGEKLAGLAHSEAEAHALRALARETPNLLSIQRRARARGRGDWALGAALALHPLLLARGPLELHRQSLVEALRQGSADQDARLRAQLALARALIGSKEIGAASRQLDEIESSLPVGAEPAATAHLAVLRGVSLHNSGSLVEARELLTKAIDLLQGADEHSLGVLRGEALFHLGTVLADGLEDEAELVLTQAQQAFGRLGARRLEARALLAMAYLHTRLGCGDPEAECQKALAVAEAAGDLSLAVGAHVQGGAAAQERGKLGEARRHYELAAETARRLGWRSALAVAMGNLGEAWEEEGFEHRARSLYQEAIELFFSTGAQRYAGWCLAMLAGVEARLGLVEQASDSIRRASDLLESGIDPEMAAVLQIQRARLELARAARAAAAGDVEGARRHLAAALPLGQRVQAGGLLNRSSLVRIAWRRYGAEEARVEVVARSTSGGEPARVLYIDRDARRVVLPDGRELDLRRRGAVRRVLSALASRARSAPGRGLTTDDLFRAGWPHENIRPEAAVERVYWAIKSLRRLGLGDDLLRQDDGYLLSPQLRVVLAED